jgi:hypothetical protein
MVATMAESAVGVSAAAKMIVLFKVDSTRCNESGAAHAGRGMVVSK